MIRRLKPECLIDWLLILLVVASALALLFGCTMEMNQKVQFFGPRSARTNAVPQSPWQR